MEGLGGVIVEEGMSSEMGFDLSKAHAVPSFPLSVFLSPLPPALCLWIKCKLLVTTLVSCLPAAILLPTMAAMDANSLKTYKFLS